MSSPRPHFSHFYANIRYSDKKCRNGLNITSPGLLLLRSPFKVLGVDEGLCSVMCDPATIGAGSGGRSAIDLG